MRLRSGAITSHRSRLFLPAAAAFAVAVGLASVGCDGVSHESLDEWRGTQKGPGKLMKALEDGDLAPDLRGHAAYSLIAIDQFAKVKPVIEKMREPTRNQVVAEIVPRLWKDAQIDGEMTVPTHRHTSSKDALFELRSLCSPETAAEIDSMLVDWFTDGYYEGRARSGRATGRMVLRAVGARAAPKVLARARSMVSRPPDADGNRPRLGDELLLGIAVTGDPSAVEFLLQLAMTERKDESLPRRSTGALIKGYVESAPLKPADPTALKRSIKSLSSLARDPNADSTMRQDAIILLATAGMPECLQPFVDMIAYDSGQGNMLWIGMQQGVRCGGVASIIPVIEAIPTGRGYARGMLKKYVWDEILESDARSQIAQSARTLLESQSWVARISGIELLGELGMTGTAGEDAKKIRELAGDKTRLKGWWGKPKPGDPGKPKPDPTLGQVARSVADKLDEVAKRR